MEGFSLEYFLNLTSGHEFKSEVVSNSMSPFLEKGDMVVVKKVPLSQIKVGEVVAIYIDKTNEAIIRRVVGKVSRNELICKADSNYLFDNWKITKRNYLGLVRKK